MALVLLFLLSEGKPPQATPSHLPLDPVSESLSTEKKVSITQKGRKPLALLSPKIWIPGWDFFFLSRHLCATGLFVFPSLYSEQPLMLWHGRQGALGWCLLVYPTARDSPPPLSVSLITPALIWTAVLSVPLSPTSSKPGPKTQMWRGNNAQSSLCFIKI